jgi:hypothetical protein
MAQWLRSPHMMVGDRCRDRTRHVAASRDSVERSKLFDLRDVAGD